MTGAWPILGMHAPRAGWDTWRIGDLVELTNGYPFDSAQFDSDGALPLVRIRDLFLDEFATYVAGPIPEQVVLRDGDIVIGMDGDFDLAVWRRGPAALNQRMCLLRPRHGVDARFVAYALPRSLRVLNDLTYATTVKHLSSFEILSERIGCPSVDGQRAIADYLDTETTQIDSLMAAKGSLLQLLSERRRAHIDWLLGQFAGARFRADLPWLSAVPDDWPSVHLGLLTDVFSGSTPTTDRSSEGEVAWTTSGELDQEIIRQPTSYISDDVRRAAGLRMAPAGSVVVGLVGQGRTRGMSATLAIDSTLNQNIAAIVPRDRRLNPEYLALLLTLAYDDLRNGGRGGNQAALNSELLRAYRIPLAPIREQRRLVEIARTERDGDERVSALLRRSVDLLLERRQALITSAVTGQLEIPGVAA